MTELRSFGPRQAACSHQPACPGCPHFGAAGLSTAAVSSLGSFCDEQGVVLETAAGRAEGYRGRARLAIRGSWRRPEVGVFERGSHRVVDIPHCVVHHPLVNRIAAACKTAIQATRTSVYSEQTHSGALRYLQVVRERRSGLAQVTVVANAKVAEIEAFLRAFRLEVAEQLHSLFVSEHRSRTNTVLGADVTRVYGPKAITEQIGGAEVFFPPDAFGQANLDLFEQIVRRIHEWTFETTKEPRVYELYAGVGAIGLGIAKRGAQVTFNELGRGSVRGLRMGLQRLDQETRDRCQIVEGDAGRALVPLSQAQVVIVDPPRKGLDPELLAELTIEGRAERPERLIYLSCALASFLRDAQDMVENNWKLARCSAYALFPFTEHVETLACFERAS